MSRLGLGCARLGSGGAGAGWRKSVDLVHAAVDLGVHYFDTADAYGAGASERILGRALRGRRERVVIATKGGYLFTERSLVHQFARATAGMVIRRVRAGASRGARRDSSTSAYAVQDFSPAYLTGALEASLRRLGTEHVDVYQLHAPRGADLDAVDEWADRMVVAGKIGCLGIGAENLEQARQWLACAAVRSVQVPYGLLGTDAGADVIPAAHASGRTVVVRGVLGAGLLVHPELAVGDNAPKRPLIDALRSTAVTAGISITDLAVGFVASRPDVDVVLVGSTSRAHLAELVSAHDAPGLDRQVLVSIDELVVA